MQETKTMEEMQENLRECTSMAIKIDQVLTELKIIYGSIIMDNMSFEDTGGGGKKFSGMMPLAKETYALADAFLLDTVSTIENTSNIPGDHEMTAIDICKELWCLSCFFVSKKKEYIGRLSCVTRWQRDGCPPNCMSLVSYYPPAR